MLETISNSMKTEQVCVLSIKDGASAMAMVCDAISRHLTEGRGRLDEQSHADGPSTAGCLRH